MKSGFVKRAPLLIAAGVIAIVCVLQMVHYDFFERLELITYDLRVRQALKHTPLVSTNLAFVSIGDSSLTYVKNKLVDDKPYGLAWPRHLYGRVVRELDRNGARAVAFDVLFEELREDHQPIIVDGQSIGSDQFFAQQLRKGSNVILAAQHGKMPAPLFQHAAMMVANIDAEQDSDGILRRARAFQTYRIWNPAFQELELQDELGVDLDRVRIETNQIVLERPSPTEPIIVPLVDGKFDLSDFYPRIPPKTYVKPFEMVRVWHMGIALAAQELKLDLDHPVIELDKGRITLVGANSNVRVIPVDDKGYFYIDWCLTTTNKEIMHESIEGVLAQYQVHVAHSTNEAAVALADFFDHRLEKFKDKLVIIGSTASGNNLLDHGATPLSKDTLLVGKHWNVANSLLTGRFIHRSSHTAEMFIILIVGAISGCLTWTWRAQSYFSSLWMVLAIIGYTAITVFAFVQFRYWMPLVMPMGGALLGTHFSLIAYLVFFEQAERRRVRSVFTKVVSPDVVTELLKSEKLSIDGAQKNITVFFCDIRGFTEMTDLNRERAEDHIKENNLVGDAAEKIRNLEAKETLAIVNQYLRIVADVVLKHGGTVDKFIGDCVMAFWGAPVTNQHHAVQCVRAAIDTQRAVYNFNQGRENENRQREAQNLMLAAEGRPLLTMLPTLVVGTGINTGVVTVGLMGSDDRVNYTVFGREVNLASRLETVSGRSRIIISEATLAEIIQDDATLALSCKPLEPVQVKGIRQPVQIYEVPWRELDKPPSAADQPPPSEAYNTGYFTAAERTE